jgi:trans-aconitate methyltransferase
MVAQEWDPNRYRQDTGFVAKLGEPLVDLLPLAADSRVLDLGCGDGLLTRVLVERGFRVVGVDASRDQVEAARALGLDARVMEGEELDFEAEFDAVFSNATLHWLKRTERVMRGVARALLPGGLFVAECGGEGNVEHIKRALVRGLERRGLDGEGHVPWLFAGAEHYQAALEQAGFELESMQQFERPTPLPGDVTAWVEVLGRSFLQALPQAERASFLSEVREELRPALQRADGSWFADYVRLRFVARKRRD